MLLLEGHTSPVYALAFSPDGRYLASGTKDGAVWVWDEGLDRREYWSDEPGNPANAIDFHPDGQAIFVGSALGWFGRRAVPDGRVKLYGHPRHQSVTGVRFLTPSLLAV